MYYYLYHSAKGTSWSKKDHKYIKKENGKYYYSKNSVREESVAYKAGQKVGKTLDNLLKMYSKKNKNSSSPASQTKKEMSNAYKKYIKKYEKKIVDFGKKNNAKSYRESKELQNRECREISRINSIGFNTCIERRYDYVI